MKRRTFVTLIGAAVAWPLAARAQQGTMPVCGFLNSGSPDSFAHFVRRFHQGLNEAGYVEGRNAAIEYRWAKRHYDRLPELAADLVGRKVTRIAASGSGPSGLSAKAATKTIPIFFVASDPLRLGLVSSLSRREGNVTGVHCHLRIPSLLMRARARATVRVWKKRLELQAHSRCASRSAYELPVATGSRS